jgi:hypothetical protein
MPQWMLALLVAYVFLFLALPLIALFFVTVMDIVGRQDIGFSKLIWVLAVLGIPLAGLLLYWLLRPKDFDPWQEPRPERRLMQPAEERLMPAASVSPRMMPALQGGADPEPIVENESEAGPGR